MTEKKKIPDLTDNDTFLKFIQGQGEQNYDSSFPMYRWKTTITNKKLQQKVDTIGEIQGIFVTSRGTGGIAQTVQIVGSEGTKTLKGQSQIRSVLGSESLVYKKNDGTELTGWSTLPSAFFSVDETARDEEKDIRTIYHLGRRLRSRSRHEPERRPGNGKDRKGLQADIGLFFTTVRNCGSAMRGRACLNVKSNKTEKNNPEKAFMGFLPGCSFYDLDPR